MSSLVRWAGELLDKADEQASQQTVNQDSDEDRKVEDELREQVRSLRSAWVDSRKQLEEARSMLLKREERHKEAMANAELLHLNNAKALEETFQEKINAIKAEYEFNLETRAQRILLLEKELQYVSKHSHAVEERSSELTERINKLEEEHKLALSRRQETIDDYSKMVKNLRKEIEAHQKLVDAEIRLRDGALEKSKSREFILEADQISYMNALSISQKELQENLLKLKHVESEKTRIEVENSILREQIVNFKKTTELEISQQQQLVEALQKRIRESLEKEKQSCNQLQELEKERSRLRDQLNLYVHASTKMTPSSNLHQQIEILEKNSSELATQLLEKQELIEQLSSQRNSYQLQYENEKRRVISLEAQLDEFIASSSQSFEKYSYNRSDIESARGGLRSRNGAQFFHNNDNIRKLSDAYESQSHLRFPRYSTNILRFRMYRLIGALDKFGFAIGSALRNSPSVRYCFLFYLMIIHLFVSLYLFRNSQDNSLDNP